MSEITASAKAQEKDKPGAKPSRSGGKRSATDPSFNMDEVRALAALFDEHGLTDFEFENENIRVRLSRMPTGSFIPQQSGFAPPQPQIAATPQAAPFSAPEPALVPEPVVDEDEGLFKITSPIVGTFYRAAGPDKEPYVKEGSRVSPESVVCIVEAMKLMNEIQAETSGEVVKIYVENGQPVEYGQPLFGIRK